MALIPPNIVAEIRDRTDIVVVVGEYVQLRRSGTNHQGLCPFHQEKSPSFTVSAAKQFFYCFGCQKSGDVFRFLMDVTGRTFVDIAQELAGRAGVVIPEPEIGRSRRPSPEEQSRASSAQSEERARLLRVNELAARFFEAELRRSESAQRYLNERGVSPEMAARFRLGYAPDAWDGMLRLFIEKKVPHELAEQAGLLIRREGSQPLPPRAPASSATHYDRFRDRIMFPLLVAGGGKAQTALGDVVAFGGRMMPGPVGVGGKEQNPGAKYINSPETPIYKKGEHLFGLHSARDVIRKQRQVVLVEGNFDVIALQQHGFDNTVAPMGTALTETQVRLLARLIGEDGHVVLMLDGDRAGRSATMKDIFLFTDQMLRGVTMLSGRDVDVRVARLPDGEDPDTFASRDPAALANVIRNAQPAVDYVLDEATAKAEHTSVGGRAKILERIAPLLVGLPNETARTMYVDRVASALDVRPELLWSHLKVAVGQAAAPQPASRGPGAPPQPAPPTRAPGRPAATRAAAQRSAGDPTELSLVALIGDHPRLLEHLQEEVLDSLENPVISELLRQAREEAEGGATISVEKLIELTPEEARPQVAAAALAGTFLQSEHPEQHLTVISRTIRTRAIQREVRDLTQHLIRTQKAGDTAASQSIFQRIQDLNRLREKIGKGEMGDPSPCVQAPPDVAGAGTVEGDHPR